MRLGLACLSFATLASAGCVAPTVADRWELPEGKISFNPICGSHRAPALGPSAPPEGLVPAVSFEVNGATTKEVEILMIALRNNGFLAAADGFFAINGVSILFAVGDGVLKTQAMADRVYDMLCRLESENIRLVHLRYNEISESRRVT